VHLHTIGRRCALFSGFGVTLAIAIVLVPSTALAQSDGRALTIDGSGARSFETSVAALQNGLSQPRREELEIALAVIWIRNTLGSGDLDRDGDVDSDDGRVLVDDVTDLLEDIQRADILSAIENGGESGYTAADYFEDLDGLAYEAVLDLAGRPGDDPYFAALTRYRSQGHCGKQREQSVVRLKWCERFSDSSEAAIVTATGKALNEAIQALNEQHYSEARAAVEKLNLDTLSPYERSKTEQVLFSISYAEEKFAEAREHLQNAIAAGGLNEQEVAQALRQIRDIDAQLAGVSP
jgi:hypothetical protein